MNLILDMVACWWPQMFKLPLSLSLGPVTVTAGPVGCSLAYARVVVGLLVLLGVHVGVGLALPVLVPAGLVQVVADGDAELGAPPFLVVVQPVHGLLLAAPLVVAAECHLELGVPDLGLQLVDGGVEIGLGMVVAPAPGLLVSIARVAAVVAAALRDNFTKNEKNSKMCYFLFFKSMIEN